MRRASGFRGAGRRARHLLRQEGGEDGLEQPAHRTISFDQVRAPAASLLGQEGEGFRIAMKGSTAAHQHRDLLDRRRTGRPERSAALHAGPAPVRPSAGRLPRRCSSLADMATELRRRAPDGGSAASKLDAGHADASVYCAMGQRFATDIGFEVCNQALQIHGGYGYIREYPLERLLRDARAHQIPEGTNEIMRVIVARRMLQDNATETIR